MKKKTSHFPPVNTNCIRCSCCIHMGFNCGVWGFLSIKSNEMLITTLKIKRDANALCRTIVVNNMNNHFMSVF